MMIQIKDLLLAIHENPSRCLLGMSGLILLLILLLLGVLDSLVNLLC